MNILVTGAAGFIGASTALEICKQKHKVIGVDNLNNYYDTRLKNYRLDKLKHYDNFTFYKLDISNYEALNIIFEDFNIEAVINLAARAGVRYSIIDPLVYYKTNVTGIINLLELCKLYKVGKFIQASTSSLYAGSKIPFKESFIADHPLSPYSSSKKAAEMACYTYHYLYNIDITVLRYFTVYGPAGRPDMSIFRFIKQIDKDETITIYGDGCQSRDFTYIDDISSGTIKALDVKGHNIINLGNNSPNKLFEIIGKIEKKLNKKARIEYKKFNKADMRDTWADIGAADTILKWQPKINIDEGIEKTVTWYMDNKSFISSINLVD